MGYVCATICLVQNYIVINSKKILFNKTKYFGLSHEILWYEVGIASNRSSLCYGEYVCSLALTARHVREVRFSVSDT